MMDRMTAVELRNSLNRYISQLNYMVRYVPKDIAENLRIAVRRLEIADEKLEMAIKDADRVSMMRKIVSGNRGSRIILDERGIYNKKSKIHRSKKK